MKTSVKYKLFGTFMILFVMLISLLFGFFVAPSRTNGNVVYWAFKTATLLWLASMIVLLWLRKTNFSKFIPPVVIAMLAQLIPSLARIGYVGENPAVDIVVIIIGLIVMFLMLSFSIIMLIAHEKFKNDEDRAIPSSNTKK